MLILDLESAPNSFSFLQLQTYENDDILFPMTNLQIPSAHRPFACFSMSVI